MFNEPQGSNMTKTTVQPVALVIETRTVLPTAEAAAHLNRADQTMRLWASRENGPLRPLRINGRLAWPVADIKRLLGVA
jgi:hypothetical protein